MNRISSVNELCKSRPCSKNSKSWKSSHNDVHWWWNHNKVEVASRPAGQQEQQGEDPRSDTRLLAHAAENLYFWQPQGPSVARSVPRVSDVDTICLVDTEQEDMNVDGKFSSQDVHLFSQYCVYSSLEHEEEKKEEDEDLAYIIGSVSKTTVANHQGRISSATTKLPRLDDELCRYADNQVDDGEEIHEIHPLYDFIEGQEHHEEWHNTASLAFVPARDDNNDVVDALFKAEKFFDILCCDMMATREAFVENQTMDRSFLQATSKEAPRRLKVFQLLSNDNTTDRLDV